MFFVIFIPDDLILWDDSGVLSGGADARTQRIALIVFSSSTDDVEERKKKRF